MRMWWVLAGVGLAAVAADAVLHVRGVGGFATDPIAALSLAIAGTVTAAIASRAPDRTRGWLAALAVAMTAYLVLGTWASASPNIVAVALWSVAWAPITGLITVVGLAAAGVRWLAVAVAVAGGAMTIASAAVVEPVAPFVGVATVAPHGDASHFAGVTDVLTTVFILVLLAATVMMIARAARAPRPERRQTLICAAVTAGGPGLVLVCLALAVLANPGDVDPTTGSVAYLVAIAGTGLLTSYTVVSFSRWALRAICTTWMLAVAVLLGVVCSPLIVTHAAIGTLAVIAIVIACLAGLVFGTRALESWSARPARLELVGGVIAELSARENEVLAMVADGATNAGIAASLYLSERTVEQHLRSVFAKLRLGAAESSNRRVRAAAIWWQHQPVEGIRAVDDSREASS